MKMEKSIHNLQRNAWSLIANLILAFAVVGCGPQLEHPKKNQAVLSPDSMAIILTDIHLVEGAKVGENMLGDSLRAPHYFREIYDKYGITENYFEKSFDHYTALPEAMNQIYEKVIENLSKLEMSPPRESLIEEKQDTVN